jgi:hypothetical protein
MAESVVSFHIAKQGGHAGIGVSESTAGRVDRVGRCNVERGVPTLLRDTGMARREDLPRE